MNEYYHITVEVRDGQGKLIEDEFGDKFIDLKFEWFVRDEDHMEWLMKDLHRTMKVWMPYNEIWISAGVFHGPDKYSQTLMNLYSYYGPEDRFVIHT